MDMSTGSLGQGISAAVGMALAGQMDKHRQDIGHRQRPSDMAGGSGKHSVHSQAADLCRLQGQVMKVDFQEKVAAALTAFQRRAEERGLPLAPTCEGVRLTTDMGWMLLRQSLHDPLCLQGQVMKHFFVHSITLFFGFACLY